MNCNYFERDEVLDYREENLLNFLKTVSTFIIGFWLSKKELRKSAKAVAINGLNQIAGAAHRGDMVVMRQYLKESLVAYDRLAFGEDFIGLLESEIKLIVNLMGKKSYAEFTSDYSNDLLISTIENNILVEGTKLNMIKY